MILLHRLSFLVIPALLLSACIAGREPLYAGVAPATPLPAEFVLVGESKDEKRAWKVTLQDGVYVWRDGDETIRSRLFPLTGEGVRAGFFVAAMDDPDQQVLYGLAEIDGRSIRSYVFDAKGLAKTFEIPAEEESFTTRFATRADLEKLFALVAARLPDDGRDAPVVEGETVRVGRFTTYDPAVPAEREAAAEMLEKYGAN
jgi:hypothetical protein